MRSLSVSCHVRTQWVTCSSPSWSQLGPLFAFCRVVGECRGSPLGQLGRGLAPALLQRVDAWPALTLQKRHVTRSTSTWPFATRHQHAYGQLFGWSCLSNATCLIQASLALCVFRRVKGHHNLLHDSSRLKKTCFRQVVLDKSFPLSSGPILYPARLDLGGLGRVVAERVVGLTAHACVSAGAHAHIRSVLIISIHNISNQGSKFHIQIHDSVC